MTPARFFQLSLLAFTIGGAFLGIYSIPQSELSEFPSWLVVLFTLSWIPGIILLISGFALLITASLGFSFVHFLKNSKYYDCRKANKSDLHNIHEMADGLFDWDISPLETMKLWHSHNNSLFWVLERYEINKKSKKKSFEGYFCVIPITEPATQSLLSGKLSGASFERCHIVPERKKVKAVYIGGIAAKTNTAKGFVMMGLKQYINHLFEHGLKQVITRPVSDDGLRVALHHGFTSIGPNDNTGNLFEHTKNIAKEN